MTPAQRARQIKMRRKFNRALAANGLTVAAANSHAAYFKANRPVKGRRLTIRLGRLDLQLARINGRVLHSAAWLDDSDWFASLVKYPRG
jgi:hypothetical protein